MSKVQGMKKVIFLIATIGLLFWVSRNSSIYADNNLPVKFPDGIIEVPAGTKVDIDDEYNVITIYNNPVEIVSGDTFIVYFQDLPIGYDAHSVSVDGEVSTISVTRADRNVYEYLNEEGTIELTEADYEFVPAENVEVLDVGAADGLSFSNGKLALSTSVGSSTAEIYISDLSLSHSISNGDVSITLNGNWGIRSTLSVKDDSLSEIPLGEIRIAGVGVIKLTFSMSMEMEMKGVFAGTFSTGINVSQTGESRATKDFYVTEESITGKGSMNASLKISAGVDVLIASADVFCEVGIDTQISSRTHYDTENEKTVHCQDFKFYLYSKAGADAKYYSLLTGKMKTIKAIEMDLIGEDDSPFIFRYHYEDGHFVGEFCVFGWEPADLKRGGFTADTGSTIDSDGRDRILETDVTLQSDVVVPQDFLMRNGSLDLNGYTLTIEGNLIQENGTLYLSNGILNVQGDYRIQKIENSDEQYQYGSSKGALYMSGSDGTVKVGGDFIIQTDEDSYLESGQFM